MCYLNYKIFHNRFVILGMRCYPTCFPFFRLTDENFAKVRILTVLSVCILRFVITRDALQSYLNMANERIKKLRREAGKITNIELQSKVRIVLFLIGSMWHESIHFG